MKYIWIKEEKLHTYAEFKTNFYYSGEGTPYLKITADYKFAAFINGNFAATGQYADLPEYKTFSLYDLSSVIRRGDNELVVKAYHSGEGFSVCRPMTASVAFAVTEGEKILCESDENTFARESSEYSRGELCTCQYGYLYNYSFTAKENPWEKATVVDPDFKEYAKPIRNTLVKKGRRAKITAQGEFKFNGGETAGELAQFAWLSPLPFNEATGKDKCLFDKLEDPLEFKAARGAGDGVFVTLDLGAECAGYPYFCIETEKDAVAYFGYGEHLDDLRPRSFVGLRNFCIKFELKKGKNDFSDYLRRIGARYYIIMVEDKSFKLHDAGIREEVYPFDKPVKDFGDKLYNAVYETGRRTLELCAHEHYEDCPWREQGLYGMDSRNQMLFGYGAFNEYDYPRAALSLMAKCIEEDGLLSLCPPSRNDITIPSFSLYYAIAFAENAERDFNAEFVKEVLPKIKELLETFMHAQKEDGALYTLSDKRYWNFHEWSEGLDGGSIRREGEIEPAADCILTALALIAAKKVAWVCKKAGETEFCKKLKGFSERLFAGLTNFYDSEKGFFASYLQKGVKSGYHEYTQAVVLLSSGDKLERRVKGELVSALKNPKGLVGITLAGLPVKYEGLLKFGGKNAKRFVLDDCMKIFGKMLLSGATSFWETAKGAADFEEAGSLCHGWSSVACYVLDTVFCK